MFKDKFIYIVFTTVHCWFINPWLMTSSTTTDVWMKLVYACIFSIRHITDFLTFVTPDSTLELCLQAILNTKIINKSTKMQTMVLNKLRKEHLLTVWEQEGRMLPCLISKGNVSASTEQFLLLCAWVCLKMTTKIQILILGYK